MGKRWLKDLKLNGVIIGQYLGSDDQEEDLAAARELLRARGIEPPSRVSVMLGQADSFAYVANATYQELRNRGADKPMVVAPFIVNAAFSVELYLKTLHFAATGASSREHRLIELYDALPEASRNEIAARARRVAAEHGENPDVQFRDLLAMINEAFVTWRYVYELERTETVHLQQTMLVMHACRDACKRIVNAGAPSGAKA
jgi:hypothetical protein